MSEYEHAKQMSAQKLIFEISTQFVIANNGIAKKVKHLTPQLTISTLISWFFDAQM